MTRESIVSLTNNVHEKTSLKVKTDNNSGSTDSGIYMSDVVCESKMDVDDTQI